MQCDRNRSCDQCCYGVCTECPVDWFTWGLVMTFLAFLAWVFYDSLQIPRPARIVDVPEARPGVAIATIATIAVEDVGVEVADEVANEVANDGAVCDKEDHLPPSYSEVHGRT